MKKVSTARVQKAIHNLQHLTGTTAEELAPLIGVHARQVYSWVNGHRITERHLKRIYELTERAEYELEGTTPEQRRAHLMESIDRMSIYRRWLADAPRKQRIQYQALSVLEKLGEEEINPHEKPHEHWETPQ
jgi:hypothetical protein